MRIWKWPSRKTLSLTSRISSGNNAVRYWSVQISRGEKASSESKSDKAEKDSDKAKDTEKKSVIDQKAAPAPEKKEKKSAWEVAEEVWGKPEDIKNNWFPFFK